MLLRGTPQAGQGSRPDRVGTAGPRICFPQRDATFHAGYCTRKGGRGQVRVWGRPPTFALGGIRWLLAETGAEASGLAPRLATWRIRYSPDGRCLPGIFALYWCPDRAQGICALLTIWPSAPAAEGAWTSWPLRGPANAGPLDGFWADLNYASGIEGRRRPCDIGCGGDGGRRCSRWVGTPTA